MPSTAYLLARHNLTRLLAQALTRYGTREERVFVNGGEADKSINEVTNDYRNRLTNFAYDAMNGRMSAVDMARAMRALIRSLADDVYLEGLREGGIADVEGELSEQDESAISEFLAKQLPYVRDFADACVAVHDPDSSISARSEVLLRVDMWVTAFRGLGELGALNAKGDPFLTMLGADGIDSCKECDRDNGKRHRKSTWQRRGALERNGNENYTCGRWQTCNHHFYYDSGEFALD